MRFAPSAKKLGLLLLVCMLLPQTIPAYAATPSPGGSTTVVSPSTEGAVSINEDAVQPESANIRLIVPTLEDSGGGTPSAIRILSVSGGTLWQGGGSSITLGAAGTTLNLSSGKLDLRFRPDAGRDTNASFRYVVVDPHNSAVNSEASTATIPITAINDEPLLQTESGNTGIGLAATYYIGAWDLTGTTFQRIDSTINFGNNFNVSGMNNENFSVRWTGQVKAAATGSFVFSTVSDDGVRLWIDDVLIIDNWTLHGDTVDTASALSLSGGRKYTIRMEFYERGGGETARLRWSYPGQSTQIIPQEYLFPATTRPALTYIYGSASAVIDDAITIQDVDSALISTGTVVISGNYQSAEDSLLFTDQNGITGSYSGGTLRLTGTASLATYQTALRSVRYANSDATPTTSTRTVQFTVSDGLAISNLTYRTITFTETNSVPVITEGASTSVTMDEDATPIPFSLTLNATDADEHSLTWSISSGASHGTATASGNGNSKSIGYVPNADYSGSDSFVVQVSDGYGGTDTITVNVTITERTPPEISNVQATVTSSGSATVTWTTNENASTKVRYGLVNATTTDTSETDTSPRVTSHEKVITGLRPCTVYRYSVVSVDAASNSATSSSYTFTTTGCAGNATVAASTGTNIIPNTGGSSGRIVLSGSTVAVVVPSGYVASNPTCSDGAQFQLKKLATEPVKTQLGVPSGRDNIVTAHDLSAYCPDYTRVTEFDEPVTVTFAYTDADVAGLVESSIGAYRFGSGSTTWEELTCTQDMAANTLTCDTTAFSSFGLFGTPVSSSSDESGVTSGTQNGGCRGTNCKSLLANDANAYKELRGIRPASKPERIIVTCDADTLPKERDRLRMSVEEASVLFEDVPVSEWFACHVHGVIERGIFSGYRTEDGLLSGMYGPGDPITVGQLAKVVTQLGKERVEGVTTGKEWAMPYMNVARRMKITTFTKKTDADAPATRGMVIRSILEALDIPMEETETPYVDVPQGSMYAAAISTATNLGIVSGDDGKDTFRPNAPINRAEVAKMITLALAIE